LARVFNPQSGRTVMLAVDHGYFQGPTTGLERIDLSIVPLLPNCDALFCTRGILRSVIPAESQKPMVLRASGGPSILKELSDEQIAMDMEDAVRLNAAGVGIQVFVGGEFETRSIHNMTRLVDAGLSCGMPVMGVSAGGRAFDRQTMRAAGDGYVNEPALGRERAVRERGGRRVWLVRVGGDQFHRHRKIAALRPSPERYDLQTHRGFELGRAGEP